tara:strand:- start:2361 stop:2732 length:372 start_codon:yes stop_codon:yes gene_type:complete
MKLQDDHARSIIVFTHRDDEDEERTYDLPATVEVCGRCGGRGVHDHAAFSNGVSQENLDDQDFREDYYSGAYDVRCSVCHGRNVQLVVDAQACDQEVLKIYYQWCDDEAAHDRETADERRMGY